MDFSEQLKQLVDRGYRVEVKGRVVEDPTWHREVQIMPAQLPDDLVLPSDHELLPRDLVRTRFWKDGKRYCCLEMRTTIFAAKPELIIP
jgi:hypothetical protein